MHEGDGFLSNVKTNRSSIEHGLGQADAYIAQLWVLRLVLLQEALAVLFEYAPAAIVGYDLGTAEKACAVCVIWLKVGQHKIADWLSAAPADEAEHVVRFLGKRQRIDHDDAV
jgi:hypothetical protein